MAYLLYTYCDQNSSTLLPYIKATYHGNLSLQQEAYWSGKKDHYKNILSDNYLTFNDTLTLSSSSSDASLTDKPFDQYKYPIKTKRNHSISRNKTFHSLTGTIFFYSRKKFGFRFKSISNTIHSACRSTRSSFTFN